MVQGVQKCPSAGICKAVLKTSKSFYSLPHTPGVVSVKVLLYALLVLARVLFDGLLQV